MNVTYEGEHEGRRVKAEIEVRQADVLLGMKRTRLRLEAEQTGGKKKKEDEDHRWLRQWVYPDLIAASQSGKIVIDGQELPWPLDFETFCTLPEGLGVEWEKAVYQCNPHWLPAVADGQKKA